jgi:hypothetical protein
MLDPRSTPNDRYRTLYIGTQSQTQASCGGHDTLEVLEVTKVLDNAGILCCLVGTSALKYFGALIMRKLGWILAFNILLLTIL